MTPQHAEIFFWCFILPVMALGHIIGYQIALRVNGVDLRTGNTHGVVNAWGAVIVFSSAMLVTMLFFEACIFLEN